MANIVCIRRELIASAPSGVLGFRVQADSEGALNLSAYLRREDWVQENVASVEDGVNSILMSANTAETDYSTFTAGVRVVVDQGKTARETTCGNMKSDSC